MVVPSFCGSKTYAQYRAEVELWQAVTEVEAEKQGIWLALALPDNHPDGLKQKILGPALGSEKLQTAELLKFLGNLYTEGKLVEHYKAYRMIEDCKKHKKISIEQFIRYFKRSCTIAEKKGMTYPSQIKAFKLLEDSGCTKTERAEIITGIRYDAANPARLFKDVEDSMKRMAGKVGMLGNFKSVMTQTEGEDTLRAKSPSNRQTKGKIHVQEEGRCRETRSRNWRSPKATALSGQRRRMPVPASRTENRLGK